MFVLAVITSGCAYIVQHDTPAYGYDDGLQFADRHVVAIVDCVNWKAVVKEDAIQYHTSAGRRRILGAIRK